MLITFNMGLKSDSKEFGTFEDWLIDLVGQSSVSETIKRTRPEDHYRTLWQLVTSKNKTLKPISQFDNNEFHYGKVGTIIVGVTDSEAEFLENDLNKDFDSMSIIYWIPKWKFRVRVLLESDISAYRISKETGVPESTIKNYRTKLHLPLDFMPIGNLEKLVSFNGLDELVTEYKKKPHD